MVSATTSTPSFSLICTLSSIANSSNVFKMAGALSRIKVPVLGSILTSMVLGTCFTHTTIFIVFSPPYPFT